MRRTAVASVAVLLMVVVGGSCWGADNQSAWHASAKAFPTAPWRVQAGVVRLLVSLRDGDRISVTYMNKTVAFVVEGESVQIEPPQAAGGEFVGTVTFRNGDTLRGNIQVADLGVVEEAGVGTLHYGFGSLRLKVGDAEQVVPARDMAVIEVEWQNQGTDAKPDWTITQVTVTKRDGTKVVGQITWKVPISIVSVVTDSGAVKQSASIPFSPDRFSPGKLITRIVIGKTPAGANITGP